jgi:secreted PhoX family phosphatase
VWECDPFGGPAVARPSLGLFKHEMAAVDPDRRHLYLTEDQPDGLIYRYTPPPGVWGSGAALDGGALEAMQLGEGGSTSWLPVPGAAAPTGPLRHAVPGATRFDGGEGAVYDQGRVFFSTKGDDRIWLHDIVAQTMEVLYDSATEIAPALTGVDNVAISAAHDLYVAEDGGNLEVCIITPERVVASVVRMTGGQHGLETGTPIPLLSEVTGLAFSPDGNRLYFNSERGLGLAGLPVGPGPGITYEVTGPFRGGTLAGEAAAPAPAPRVPAVLGSTQELPATGGRDALAGAAAAAIAGGALLHLRRRAEPPAAAPREH